MERDKRVHAEYRDGHYVVDLTQNGSPLLEGLKQPIRVIEFELGQMIYKMPRGADDPTPDDVVELGGIYINTTDGRISKDIPEVNGKDKA